MNKRLNLSYLVLAGLALQGRSAPAHLQSSPQFRPPAVPLVTSDPYLSIWSEADRLTDDVTRHWTHRPHPLTSLMRIDGTAYRLMGNDPESSPAMPQLGLKVTPTKTTYQFGNDKVTVTLAFLTPALPFDLNVLTRPVTYLTWTVASADGADHRIEIYDGTSSQIAVNSPGQKVTWSRETFGDLTALKTGTEAQTLLRPAGDDTRIDWGYAYAVAKTSEAKAAIGDDKALLSSFISSGELPTSDDSRQPRASNDDEPVLAYVFSLGSVGKTPVARRLMVGYDEIYSIGYFGKKLPPYWRRNGAQPSDLFQKADREYDQLVARCGKFDDDLTADATKLGGPEYAQILALAYRECLAANGIAADANKQPLLFTKENTSNGDLATVDVIFPMDPMFVLLSPTLAEASLVSNFDYAASPHWKFPNAPHDLGTYPLAFGRDDGGEGMPVEESGNMIILTDAIEQIEGNSKFAERYWPQLTQWANYLEKYGLDPEDQLCTDDFMGHLAHNANLSVKAILALAAYGDLCRIKGDEANAKRYAELARVDGDHWVKTADAGDKSLLAFDQPNTWSQKYNLVWDKILNLKVFPDSVPKKEIAFYKSALLPYGFPLDSRTHLTKTDWSIWSATMADNLPDFETLVSPIYRYLDETTARDPIADSYVTDDVKSGGMHARPVVGGFFIRMLTDRTIWKEWASRDKTKLGNWAPLPKPPVITEVVPTARTEKLTWRYSLTKPSDGWTSEAFDDKGWSEGKAGFGTEGTPNAVVGTTWSTDDIWIRRTLTVPNVDVSKLKLLLYHDEDAEVYFNGVLAASEPGYYNEYAVIDIDPAAQKLLAPGAKITLAVHCHQTTGGQGIDLGFALVKDE
jgi:hypothetical protein